MQIILNNHFPSSDKVKHKTRSCHAPVIRSCIRNCGINSRRTGILKFTHDEVGKVAKILGCQNATLANLTYFLLSFCLVWFFVFVLLLFSLNSSKSKKSCSSACAGALVFPMNMKNFILETWIEIFFLLKEVLRETCLQLLGNCEIPWECLCLIPASNCVTCSCLLFPAPGGIGRRTGKR